MWINFINGYSTDSKLLIYFGENFQVRKMQKNVEICKRDKIT